MAKQNFFLTELSCPQEEAATARKLIQPDLVAMSRLLNFDEVSQGFKPDRP